MHVDTLNARLGKPYVPMIGADFGGVVKGLKSLASMEDKVASELARAKIAANETADRIQGNLAHLNERDDHAHLFADAATLVLKAPDDFAAVVSQRIAAFADRERAKEEATRERIRAEEAQRLQAEAQAAEALRTAAAPPPSAPAKAGESITVVVPTATPTAGDTLTLGALCKLIAPITVTADGLRALGFEPAGRERAAVLYLHDQVPAIAQALIDHLVPLTEIVAA